jgi:putative peptidoglycan lipid II flippase
LSLAFWAAQGLYSRAFYAAGNTLTPMIASSVITLVSLPIYAALFRSFSTVGLVVASDLGIIANCSAMALLLHHRSLVSVRELNWKEIGKAATTAVFAGYLSMRVGDLVALEGRKLSDLKALAITTLTWVVVAAFGLWVTRSELPGELRRMRRQPTPATPRQN